MGHSLRVERVFNLGDYKSLRIVVEATDIPEDQWNDKQKLEEIRTDLQREIMASYALHMMTATSNTTEIREGNYETIYGKYS